MFLCRLCRRRRGRRRRRRCRRHTYRFRLITFEGMYGFHSNFAELYITIKYRSSSILVIIHQILAELWPFFDLVFVGVLILFPINNFCRDALILLKVCRRIYHCKIQVKFDISNYPQNFG